MHSVPIESALIAVERRGVHVSLAMTVDASWSTALARLSRAGVTVDLHPDASGNLYIHGKAIVVDGTTAYVGSQNFSPSSLDADRELGVITTDPAVVTPSLRRAADAIGGR